MDLLVDILVLIERESAREGDVDDHTGAPHVQGPEVTKISFENHKKYISRVFFVCYGHGGAKKQNSDSEYPKLLFVENCEYPILLFAQNRAHQRNPSV